MTPPTTLLLASVYVATGRWLVQTKVRGFPVAFALLNLVAVYVFYFGEKDRGYTLQFVVYVALVGVQYAALRIWSDRAGWLPWLAFLTPIAILVVLRVVTRNAIGHLFGNLSALVWPGGAGFIVSSTFFGMSYLAFRTSYLVLEVRNGVVPRPGFWEYLGFAFFAPTFAVGPINRYGEYHRAFQEPITPGVPHARAGRRVLVGAVKFGFLGPWLNQLTYSGLMLEGYPHAQIDLLVAIAAYYLFLYCNFSGFCDIAIGGAGLMGLTVDENFANPFAARNVKDFWNRWHITLSRYMRDVVFSPLSKRLVSALGPARANHAIAATIVVVFMLIGLWHGAGLNFAAFGAAHAIGVVANHYYALALKRRLGKAGFAAYNANRAIRAVAVTLTFSYVAATLFLFANDWDTMKTIFGSLRAA